MADRLRRRLGQRFSLPGREITTIAGTLTVGSAEHSVTLTRAQDDGGERVAISLDNGPANLAWDGTGGATSSGNKAGGSDRALIERLALDSPDQFVLAQLRPVAYYTIAYGVRPSGISDDYAGPVWDMVRLGEVGDSPGRPQSEWRLYYVNSDTGLIDKVMSDENGQRVLAEFSGWAVQGTEKAPTHIAWNINNQVVMSLSVTGIGYSAAH